MPHYDQSIILKALLFGIECWNITVKVSWSFSGLLVNTKFKCLEDFRNLCKAILLATWKLLAQELGSLYYIKPKNLLVKQKNRELALLDDY